MCCMAGGHRPGGGVTLIAIHATPTGIVAATDTLGTSDRETFVSVSKIHYLPHIDTAIAVNGSHYLAEWVLRWANSGGVEGGFDGLSESMVDMLPEMWDRVAVRYGKPGSAVYLLGWSHERGRYAAIELNCGEEVPVDARYRPIDLTIGNPRSRPGSPADDVFTVRPHPDPFRLYDTSEAPATAEGWIELAEQVRAEQLQRIAAGRGGVMIGGTLHLTRLEAHGVTQLAVHQFADEVAVEQPVTAGTSWSKVGRNERCPCGSGRKSKHCCGAA